jgi:hypothetical protein
LLITTITAHFRGAAHSLCNLIYQNPKFIPNYIHNFAEYDSHLFVKQFGKDEEYIKLIPNTEEKYISFSKALKYDSRNVDNKGKLIINYIQLRFIDSFKLMSSSLDKLSKNLKQEQFKVLSKYFPREHLDLITRKLAYPYEYLDSPEKYLETELPPIEKFYTLLNNESVNKRRVPKCARNMEQVSNQRSSRIYQSL